MPNQNIFTRQAEKALATRLQTLHDDWQKVWETYREAHCNDPRAYGIDELHHNIIRDGFYPNYLAQKPKILFIGRECYALATLQDCNYINLFTPCYQTGLNPSQQSLNQDRFHKLLLKVAYGITHNIENYADIPQPSEICNKDIFNHFSFAFMNLSKLSNEGDCYTTTDWSLVETSLQMSLSHGRNFILEEIALLDPDLIVAMNWGSHCFNSTNTLEHDRQSFRAIFGNQINIQEDEWSKYTLILNKKKILLLDQWHFSSRKSEDKDIYAPIYEAWEQFKNA